MKAKAVVWLGVCGGLILVLSATDLRGWWVVPVVAAVLMLTIPLTVQRYRLERKLARKFWDRVMTGWVPF